MVASILIVDDDPAIAGLVKDHLVRAGHAVEIAHDGLSGSERARAAPRDLMVLDVMLPGASGLEVCAEVRRGPPPQPVILMLTARASEEDAVQGFESGADDYVRKPFGVAELVARIEALLALRARAPLPSAAPQAGIEIDPRARTATVLGRQLRLTPKEHDLLAHFVRHPGVLFARDALLVEVWGYRHAGYARTVDSHVTRIRKKLALAGLSRDPITTVHGVGYRFEPGAPGLG